MNVLFNTFGQAEELGLTLCLPSSKATEKDGSIYLSNTVGAIPNASSLSVKLPFNAYAEMSFSVDRSACPHQIFDRIEMGMYVFAEGIGYFVINDNKEERDYLGNVQTKTVSLASCEYELYDSEAPAFEDGLYQIHNDDGSGVINQCAELAPRWRFSTANISPSLFAKERRFTDVETENMYDFLITDTQDSFECVVEFDRIFREVKLIDREDYFTAHETDIHLSRANVIDKLTKESSSEDFYTGIRVSGEEDLSIRITNPTGEEVIYNFDYRLPWMSTALQDAIAKWKMRVSQEKDGYRQLALQWVEANGTLTLWESRLTGANEEIAGTNQAIANYAQLLAEATDDEKIAIKQLLEAEQDHLLTLQITCSQIEDDVSEARENLEQLDAQMRAVNEECKLGTSAKDVNGNLIFTEELLEELSAYISVGEYTDEYMAQSESMTAEEKLEMAAELMSRAESQLVKIASDNYKFTVENRDFLFDQKFQAISEKLIPGAIIWVETDDDTVAQFHLSDIDISYEDKTCSLTFSNKYNKYDLQSLFDEVFGAVKKNASSLKYLTDIIVGQTEKIEQYGDWIDAAMTLTATHALQSDTQEVRIDNIGYWGRRLLVDENGTPEVDQNDLPLYSPEQIRIMSNGVYLTDDNWHTVKSAIGKIVVGENDDGTPLFRYGVVGDVLIGKVIAGTNLTIQSEGSDGIVNTVIDKSGVSVYNGDLTIYANEWGASSQSKVFYFDHDANVLTVSGKIIAQAGTIGGWDIGTGILRHKYYDATNNVTRDIYMQTSIGDTAVAFGVRSASGDFTHSTPDAWSYHFSVRNNGQLNASNAVIEGKITATSGTIGGWDVTKNSLDYLVGGAVKAFLSGTGSQSGTYTVGDSGGRSDWTMWAGNFGVTNGGYLYATGANISGTIKATSGEVGGLNIKNQKLFGITGTTGSMANNDYTCYVSGLNSLYNNASNNTIFLWAGAKVKNKTRDEVIAMFGNSTWTDAKNAITDSASFYVTHTGALHATGVDISGTVKATKGNIGSWTINGDVLEGTHTVVIKTDADSNGVLEEVVHRRTVAIDPMKIQITTEYDGYEVERLTLSWYELFEAVGTHVERA